MDWGFVMSQDLYRVVRIDESAPRVPSVHVGLFWSDAESGYRSTQRWSGLLLCEELIEPYGDRRVTAGNALTALGTELVFWDMRAFGLGVHCEACSDELTRRHVAESSATLKARRVSA